MSRRYYHIIVEMDDGVDALERVKNAATGAIARARETFIPEMLSNIPSGGMYFRPFHDKDVAALLRIGPAQ